MAVIVAEMPKFSIEDGDSIDTFVQLLNGYLNTVGINPNADGGPPTGKARAMGVLRSCLRGSIAEWFDENILGKNWKLTNLRTNGTADMATLRALAVREADPGLHPNSYVPGSPAHVYSLVGANATHTIGDTMIPNHDIFGGDAQWELVGAEPAIDAANDTNSGDGNPIVLPGIRLHQALSYMRRKLPIITDEKRKIQLHRLVQGNDDVRTFWKRVERAGKLLRLPQELIVDHFYRGLSPENNDKAMEFDPDYPITKVVDILEKIEKRKFSRQLGDQRKKTEHRYISPEEVPPVHMPQQESGEYRKITPNQIISKEHIDQIVNTQADKIAKGFQDQFQAFQTQIQALQNTISQQQQQQQLPKRKSHYPITPVILDEELKPKPGQKITLEDALTKEQERLLNEISAKELALKRLRVANDMVDKDPAFEDFRLWVKARAEAKKIKDDREVKNLARQMDNLNLNDDPMDTSNLADGSIVLQDADGNEFTAYLTRGKGSKKN